MQMNYSDLSGAVMALGVMMLCLFSALQFSDNLVVLLSAESVEEHDASCDYPEHSRHRAEGMVNHLLHRVRLHHVGLVAGPSHDQGQQ